MAKERCTNCGVILVVPSATQTVQCPVCKGTFICNNNNSYIVPFPSPYEYRPPRPSTQVLLPYQRPPPQVLLPFQRPPPQDLPPLPQPTPQAMPPLPQPPPQAMPPLPRPSPQASPPLPRPSPQASPRLQRPLPQALPPLLSPQVLPSLSVHGGRRAVLIGISYHRHQKNRKGSINDVWFMRNLLLNRFGFPKESILVLTEEEMDPSRRPTKRNIRTAMRWLIQGCRKGDSLVFHYSGNATKVVDKNGDEADRYDEALCPIDYLTEGSILDDEINDTIVRPLPFGAKLHAIMDCNFSGTILDLPFICQMDDQGSYAWEDHSVFNAYKGTSGGTAICFSACDDSQSAVDTTAFPGNTVVGAMTYSFIQAVEYEPGSTYGSLLSSIRSKVGEAQKRLYKLDASPTSQVPQLSSTETFAVHLKPFVL